MNKDKIKITTIIISSIIYGTVFSEIIDKSFLGDYPAIIYIGVRIILFLLAMIVTVYCVMYIHKRINKN